MKKCFILSIIILCSVLFSRLGETLNQVEKRYGKIIEREGKDGYWFKFKKYSIYVLIYKGISIGEEFSIRKGDTIYNNHIPEDEREIILKANIGEGYKTEYDIELFLTIYTKGRYVADYDQLYFTLWIIDTILYDEWDQKKMIKEDREGF